MHPVFPMPDHEHIVAIVPAGGKGVRAGLAQPKQLALVDGVPVLARAVAPLARHSQIAAVVVAVRPDMQEPTARALARHPEFAPPEKVRVLPVGKESRAQTVAAALCESCADNDWALVHDAVRPFLSADLLSAVIAAALKDGVGAAPLRPVSEALKKADSEAGKITESVPRRGFFLAQTPQMFRAAHLKKALAQNPNAPDECEAMHQLGFQFGMTPGHPRNIKLTFPDDFVLAEALAQARVGAEAA